MKAIAAILIEKDAVKIQPEKPFTYTSGIISPIYTDNRVLISSVTDRKIILDAFVHIIQAKGIDCDVVAGTATAAIPWGAWLADRLEKSFVYIRSSKKSHGAGNQIEGRLASGSKVLLIEDLISTGGSSLGAAEAIKEAGCMIEHCLAIFSYGMQKATEGFKHAHVQLHTLTSFAELIDEAIARDAIKESDRESVLSWARDPEGWHV
ncbi:MAG: orotate phosphoribosyltransferase [Nanoarchaeota archaeon]